MKWSDVRKKYPDQWLIIEALEAHTTKENIRQIGDLAVIETCADGDQAMARYRELHQKYPQREFYFIHTRKDDLIIKERQWHGIRRSHAIEVN